MATVFVVGERLFVKDGEGMSQERREIKVSSLVYTC